MRVTLINEFSQACKNALIMRSLESSAAKYGIELCNTGMKSDNEKPLLNYIHLGIQAFVLLNTGAVDFVITGCGSGQGACMSLNSYPGVNCGYVTDASDAFLFTQINDGNAIALPFAKDFGWAAELKLEDIFDKIFSCERGAGYPVKMKAIQRTNSDRFNSVKRQVCKSPEEILQALEQPELLDSAFAGQEARRCFLNHAKPCELTEYMMKFLNEKVHSEAVKK